MRTPFIKALERHTVNRKMVRNIKRHFALSINVCFPYFSNFLKKNTYTEIRMEINMLRLLVWDDLNIGECFVWDCK